MATPLLKPVESWNAAMARHLLNRAGFGGPSERLARLAKMDAAQAVSYFVDFEAQPGASAAPEFLVAPKSPEEVKQALAGVSRSERRKKVSEYQQEERGVRS